MENYAKLQKAAKQKQISANVLQLKSKQKMKIRIQPANIILGINEDEIRKVFFCIPYTCSSKDKDEGYVKYKHLIRGGPYIHIW